MNHMMRVARDSAVTFGKRKVRPRVCVVDAKQHIRSFLSDTLEDYGFIPSQCAHPDDLVVALDEHLPDLVVLGFSEGGIAVRKVIDALLTLGYDGKVLLIGPAASPMVKAVRDHGKSLGLSMLPVLSTPFGDTALRDSVAGLLSGETPPDPAVDITEALAAGWLELWYQPKVTAERLTLAGAEALIRMRHPTWGIVQPTFFLPDRYDPNLRALSRFIVERAMADWNYFLAAGGAVPVSLNLPLAFFQEPDAIEYLRAKLPRHPAFLGLTVEFKCADVVDNPALAIDITKQLRFHNIGVCIDGLGSDWPELLALDEFPFMEVKIDRRFVNGCSSDPLKRSVCRQVIDFAERNVVKTVAEGLESERDLDAVRELGVDAMQGFLFAKPMIRQKFARTAIDRVWFEGR